VTTDGKRETEAASEGAEPVDAEAAEAAPVEEPLEPDEPAYPGADTDERPGLEKTRPTVAEEHLKGVLESLVFVSDRPVTVRRLARITKAEGKQIRKLLEELVEDYAGRGVLLLEVAGGFQFRSAPANAPFVREIVAKKPIRLSRAQLEVTAIVAYRQPLTRPEIEEIRGVDSASALKVLLERNVVKVLGRKEEPGRPLLYGTTPTFLELFGMAKLDDLPTLKEFSELTEESKALFARKLGEEIDTIGDIELPLEDADEELEDADAQAEELEDLDADPAQAAPEAAVEGEGDATDDDEEIVSAVGEVGALSDDSGEPEEP
jgi:segregation and condensation protein B